MYKITAAMLGCLVLISLLFSRVESQPQVFQSSTPSPHAFAELEPITRQNVDRLIPIKELNTGAPTEALAWLPNGQILFFADAMTGIWQYNIAEWSDHATQFSTFGAIFLETSFDGSLLVAASHSEVHIWSLSNGRQLTSFRVSNNQNTILGMSLHPDGHLLATVDSVGHVGIWDIDAAQEVHQLNITSFEPLEWTSAYFGVGISFTPNGEILAVGSAGDVSEVYLWAYERQRSPNVLTTPSLALESEIQDVTDIAFSSDGQLLAATTCGRAIFIWNTEERGDVTLLQPMHSSCLLSAALNLDGTLLITGAEEIPLDIWDLALGEHLLILEPGRIFGGEDLAFSPNGTILAGAFKWKGVVHLWGVPSH